MNDKSNQKGATMMEMLGVLTIVILLSVSIIQLIGSVFNMFRESLVANEVKDLQKAITDRYRFEGNYRRLFEEHSDVEAFLCESKLAPFQMCSNGALYHRMGGEVSIAAWDEEYDKYSIIFYDMPKKACIRAGEINWQTQQKMDIFKMIINEEKVFDSPANPSAVKKFPVSSFDVRTACNGDVNTIQWVFY